MMGRIRLQFRDEEVEMMTYGRWHDLFASYKFLYNFETKKLLYADAEEETRKYQQEHRPIASIMEL